MGLDKKNLPALRQDLQFYPQKRSASQENSWIMHDSLQHRYFRIDENTRLLISIWNECTSAETIIEKAREKLNLVISQQDIQKLLEFLCNANLLIEHQTGHWQDLSNKAALSKKPLISKILRGHLFFRVPLIRPSRFLEATSHLVSLLYSKTVILAVLVLGLVGLYLATRDLAELSQAFKDGLTLNGSLHILIAVMFVKILHEFGHAYAATRLGCRVPTMGVAFMVFVPVFYTDISDTWRLSNRRQKMLVGGAGVLVEIVAAMLATFLWVFMENGSLRDVVFILATISWIISLGINLNPFMKFDGYYLLSDYLVIDNLQSRSFGYARWWVRRLLFAPDLQPPETCNRGTVRFFVVYAIATWLYRLLIFTTIALFIYHFAFKALGILLFALEIWLLVLRPVFNELREWRQFSREHVSMFRISTSITVSAALLLAFFLPWSTTVRVPAVLQPSDLTQIYPPRPARIMKVDAERNQQLSAGDPILRLELPELNTDIEAARIELDQIRLQLDRSAADQRDRSETIVLNQEFGSRNSRLSGLQQISRELIIRSPIAGRLVQVESDLHEGRWVQKEMLLALVTAQEDFVAKGYIQEGELHRIGATTSGKFIPEDLSIPTMAVNLKDIAVAGSSSIQILELLEINGGLIAVNKDKNGAFTPVSPQYRVSFDLLESFNPPKQIVRGTVHLRGKGRSIAEKFWQQVARVLVKESVF